MKPKPESELVLNDDGSIYHLQLHSEQIADTILVVGDQGRVQQISKHFDRIEHKVVNREFVTHTGNIGNKRLTALSTGIGTDNIDIVMNELDALVNIDFKKRIEKREKKVLNIIRLGTSGAVQKDIPIDCYIASTHGMGMDNLMYYYANNSFDTEMGEAFKNHANWPKDLSLPYFYKGSDILMKKFSDLRSGITATSPGFYGPQGRNIRLPFSIPVLHEQLNTFKHGNIKITNFEMETAALYGLGKLLGHQCLTICAILANRIQQQYSKNYKKTISEMIPFVLERLTHE